MLFTNFPGISYETAVSCWQRPIFQLARVFRDDELGRWHNPEFTLLEWYQLHIDHHVLMDEVDLLLQIILKSRPMIRKTYQQAFEEACGIDPFSTSIEQFNKVLAQHDLDGVLSPNEQDRDQYLFLLMSHVVEPFLAEESTPLLCITSLPPRLLGTSKRGLG